MSRFFAVVVAVILFGGSAWAAPAAAPAFSWTGCYVGGNVGGGWGPTNISGPTGFVLPPPADPAFAFQNGTPFGVNSLNENMRVSGLIGGAQAGCRYQTSQNWVIGLEGEYARTRLTGDHQVSLTPVPLFPDFTLPANLHVQTDWIASATATLGYAFDGVLLYGKAGAAWTANKYDIKIGGPDFADLADADFRAQDQRIGWTAGAGIEYPFADRFSAKLEYDYFDFGTRTVDFIEYPMPSSSGAVDIRQRVHAVKVGINYNLWSPPASAISRPSATPAMAWSEAFSSETHYTSWTATRGTPTNAVRPDSEGALGTRGSGEQLYTPYAAELVGEGNDLKIEMVMRGGWVMARQSTAGLTGSVSTATDTVTSGTVTYLGLRGLQPFVSLDLNLPTGLAALTATQVNARMDPDLVDISTFGEGLNVGPTIGVNVPLGEAWLLTLSAGYTRHGVYAMEGPMTPAAAGAAPQSTNINPGDTTTVTGVLGYQSGRVDAKLTGTITGNGTTKEDDQPFIRPGLRYLIAATASYTWPGDHSGTTTLNVTAAHSNHNAVLFQCMDCPTTLVGEPFNTNSNVYQMSAQHLFSFDKWSAGPTGSFLFRDNNGYEPTTLQFVPKKQRWSAGILAQYAANDVWNFNARVERIWTRENDTPAFPDGEMYSVLAGTTLTSFAVPLISSDAWQFALGITATF